MASNLHKALLDVSVNYEDILKRLSVNNEEVVEQSPICRKILAGSCDGLADTDSPPASGQDDGSYCAPVAVASTSPGGQGPDASLDSVSSGGGYMQDGRTAGSGVSSGDGGSSGGVRGVGLTMKEYDQHLARLNKENFALKLRVYFLEEQQGQAGQAAPQLYKANIELKVENESLKRQVFDKQQLLSQAASALTQLEEEYREQVSDLLSEQDRAVQRMQDTIDQLHKTVAEYADKCRGLEATVQQQQQQPMSNAAAMSELTQLCDLAFPSSVADDTNKSADCWNPALWHPSEGGLVWGSSPAGVWGVNVAQQPQDCLVNKPVCGSEGGVNSAAAAPQLQRKLSTDSQTSQNGSSFPGSAEQMNNPVHINTTNVTNNNINNTLPNTSNNLQQMQYQHQQPHPSEQQQQHSASPGAAPPHCYPQGAPAQQHYHYNYQPGTVVVPAAATGAMALQQLPASPAVQGAPNDSRVRELEQQMAVLQYRLQQLQLQLCSKDQVTLALTDDIDNLKKELQDREGEVLEREEKVESLSQELETRHRQLQTKETTIHTLHDDLNRVEPEISVKVQEIVERDRIIEQKIEQIEQQNKILVEIQITLDEKQKQIAELEANLGEARDRVKLLEGDYEKSCTTISGFMDDLSTRDKEVVALKKEVKRRDHKIKNLVAELKETLDMLGKAKWEAETSGSGEDTVKEMVEDENEMTQEIQKSRSRNKYPTARMQSSNVDVVSYEADNLIYCKRQPADRVEASHTRCSGPRLSRHSSGLAEPSFVSCEDNEHYDHRLGAKKCACFKDDRCDLSNTASSSGADDGYSHYTEIRDLKPSHRKPGLEAGQMTYNDRRSPIYLRNDDSRSNKYYADTEHRYAKETSASVEEFVPPKNDWYLRREDEYCEPDSVSSRLAATVHNIPLVVSVLDTRGMSRMPPNSRSPRYATEAYSSFSRSTSDSVLNRPTTPPPSPYSSSPSTPSPTSGSRRPRNVAPRAATDDERTVARASASGCASDTLCVVRKIRKQPKLVAPPTGLRHSSRVKLKSSDESRGLKAVHGILRNSLSSQQITFSNQHKHSNLVHDEHYQLKSNHLPDLLQTRTGHSHSESPRRLLPKNAISNNNQYRQSGTVGVTTATRSYSRVDGAVKETSLLNSREVGRGPSDQQYASDSRVQGASSPYNRDLGNSTKYQYSSCSNDLSPAVRNKSSDKFICLPTSFKRHHKSCYQ